MIKAIEITNFRGFDSISLSNLPRFNFLIGESGSGKTALLEALWITGGISPEIYFRMRALRGMAEDHFQIRSERAAYEGVFRDMFHNPSDRSGVRIHIMDSDFGDRRLSISYDENQTLPLEPASGNSVAADANVRPIIFHWRVGDADFSCPLRVEGGRIIVDRPPSPFPAILLSSSFLPSARENAERLSQLSITKTKGKIVRTINKIFPDLINLSSESIGGQQMVWAEMRNLPELIPVAAVSSGVNKYLSVLLCVAQNAGGVLLIDEIENGFYFQNFEVILKSIIEFCFEYNVQLFASTHSWEFLKAVANVMEDRKQDMAVLKTSASHGACQVRVVEGISSIAAINQDIEIRK